MYINDRALNDTNFHNGSTITEKDSESYTNGTFVANQSNGTAKYVFSRTPNKDHYFTLTPEKDSFYKFSGASSLEIAYKKTALLVFSKTVNVNPEPDGTYNLKKGITYTIKMRTSSGEFSVQQDNWVYAPNGGKWTAGPNKYSAVMEQMYIPSDKLIDAVKSQSLGWAGVNNSQPIENQVQTVMNELKLEDDGGALRDSIASLVFSIIGGSSTVGALAAEKASKIVIALAVAGDGHTIYSLFNDSSNILDWFDAKGFRAACQTGNLNVIAYKPNPEISSVWNPWTTNGYINKYYLPGNNSFIIKGMVSLNPSLQDIIDYFDF